MTNPENGLVSLVNRSLDGDRDAVMALSLIVKNFDFKTVRGMFNTGEDCLYALGAVAKCMPKDRDAVNFLKENPIGKVFSNESKRRAVV